MFPSCVTPVGLDFRRTKKYTAKCSPLNTLQDREYLCIALVGGTVATKDDKNTRTRAHTHTHTQTLRRVWCKAAIVCLVLVVVNHRCAAAAAVHFLGVAGVLRAGRPADGRRAAAAGVLWPTASTCVLPAAGASGGCSDGVLRHCSPASTPGGECCATPARSF